MLFKFSKATTKARGYVSRASRLAPISIQQAIHLLANDFNLHSLAKNEGGWKVLVHFRTVGPHGRGPRAYRMCLQRVLK
ncbi:MAG: hypothetical protein WBN40_06055, partial [Pseudomonadales bacterium]